MVGADPKLRDFFSKAVQCQTPEEQAAYLEQVCRGDAELRARLEELLQAHREAGSFLQEPSAAPIPTVDEPRVSERPGTVIGPYKLLQQIGEGGMGTVFMAEQTQPVQRKVALKVIKAGMDSRQVIARFEAERQALAMMDHVNIARVLDAGATEGGRPYFVMELVHGVPITKYCDDNHLTPRQRLELFVPVCQAIQHAHQKGIIHRDVKPSNVMVTLYDGKPVPKVIDFGVAKATEQKLTERTLFTQYGTMVGTLEYMSPEQAEMSALGVDTRSDIYSLGVLLYELLTGSTPLTHKRIREAAYAEVLRMIKEEEPPKPSTRLSDSGEALASISAQRHMEPAKLTKLMRGELDWIVMKTLDKDRNRRYETANGFAADVQRYLNDEPVQACPASAVYRLRKFARRNKTALATTAVLVLAFLLVAGTLGWSVRDRSAREQEVASNQAAREAALDHQVRKTLADAEAVLAQGKWPEAAAAVGRAEKLLAAAGRQELPPRLLALQKDLAFAQRLEDIYSKPKTEEFFHGHEPDAAYAQAFADAGIDVAALSVSEAAQRIRARGIRRELARALDFWSQVRKKVGKPGPPDWQRLVEIAEAADPDPWRNRLRQARKGGDRKALETLAASADVAQLPPETVLLLANALYDSGGTEQAMDLLRQACLHYPDDWYLSNTLGWYSLSAQPPRYDDAVRYYTASQVARPRNAYNLGAIAQGLTGKKAYAEAIAVLSRAIELKGDLWDARFRRAEAYLKLGETDKADADYSKAVELDPKNAGVWANRGWSFFGLEQWDKAIADYSKAIELDPKDGSVWANRGYCYNKLAQWDKAIADFSKAIELDRKDAWVWGNRGWSFHGLKQWDKAIADYSKAIELDPKDAGVWNNRADSYYNLQQWDKAIADYSKAIELDPKNAGVWNNRGWAYHNLQQRDKAIAEYSKAIELNPKLSQAWINRGLAYHQLQQWDKAIADYSRFIELDPKNAGVWHNRGLAYQQLQRWDKAIADYSKAIELDPKYVSAWYNRGWAHNKLKQWDKAIADCSKAIELDPKYVSAWDDRGWAYIKLKQWDKAIGDYSKVIDLAPNGSRGWDGRGAAYMALGEYDKAVADFSKGLKLDPGDERARFAITIAHLGKAFGLKVNEASQLNNRAWLLATYADPKVRDPKQAVDLARKAVKLAPREGSFWNTLGVAHYRAGDCKAALEALANSMQLRQQGDSFNWFFLAMAHWQLGHQEEARKWYGRAVLWMDKNQPKNEELRRFRAEAGELLKMEKKAKPK